MHTESISFTDFIRSSLNQEQQDAVLPAKGTLLVIAGAGSGKTRVITSRIINLIINHGVEPSTIVALTFTNKAAREMKERIEPFLQEHNIHSKPFIGTFHSYCLYILRNNANLLPFSPFTILDADDQQSLLQRIIKRHTLEKRISAKNLGYYISTVKNNLTSQYQDFYDPLISQLAQIYEQEKTSSKLLDFDDLLLQALNILEKNVEFKKRFQQSIRHILVDEYQDTNTVQHALLKNMALYNASFAVDSLCVVGDEDQSIYSWRGATIANIINFKKDFPKTKTITIEQNYRSVQPILETANAIIENNIKRNPKQLWSSRKAQDRVRILTCVSGNQESDAMCQLVDVVRKNKLGSCAILYRAHYQSRVIEEALLRNSIAYHIIGGIQFYERKEIKDIFAYLKLIQNPFDRVSFFRVVNCPSRGLGQKFEEDFITEWETQPFLTFHDVANKLINDHKLPTAKKNALQDFLNIFKNKNGSDKPCDVIDDIIKKIRYHEYLKDNFDPEEAQAKVDNLKELLRGVKYFEEQGLNTIEALLHEIALMQEKMKDQKEQADCVQLMTLHAAKGLEFDVIILSGLEEGIFPSTHMLNQQDQIEEERRLFYVGITRAKEYLLLSHARFRYTFGSMNDQMPSRFLKEIPTILAQKHDGASWNSAQYHQFFSQWLGAQKLSKKLDSNLIASHRASPETHSSVKTTNSVEKNTKETTESTKATVWKKNQPVSHPTFGIGIIKEIEHKNDDTVYLTAQFPVGLKKIKSTFIEKI